jgi:hypothetical protein
MLAMNRDEKKSRPRAHVPRRHRSGTHAALYPSETGGGTWIGVNDAGLALALINWYAKPQRDRALCISRGVIIPRLLGCATIEDAGAALADLPLSEINPFRLIAVSLRARGLREWRWDGAVLECRRPGWKRRHWFSSGHDETGANRKRTTTVREAARSKTAETPGWLRVLHRGHRPEKGAYAICMHREDAQTVSYTEIVGDGQGAVMRYAAGPPCSKRIGAPRLLSFASEAAAQPR